MFGAVADRTTQWSEMTGSGYYRLIEDAFFYLHFMGEKEGRFQWPQTTVLIPEFYESKTRLIFPWRNADDTSDRYSRTSRSR